MSKEIGFWIVIPVETGISHGLCEFLEIPTPNSPEHSGWGAGMTGKKGLFQIKQILLIHLLWDNEFTKVEEALHSEHHFKIRLMQMLWDFINLRIFFIERRLNLRPKQMRKQNL